MERARGKVLMIDEAYLLYRAAGDSGTASGSMFGQAVLDTLVSGISPEPNQDSVVILAGYPDEMKFMMKANQGLARRFPRKFTFRD